MYRTGKQEGEEDGAAFTRMVNVHIRPAFIIDNDTAATEA